MVLFGFFLRLNLLAGKLRAMGRKPVLTRLKPIVSGVPPITSINKFFEFENIVIPRIYHTKQNYFAIEVLPKDLIDSDEVLVVAGNNPLVLGFLLSSVFPIWVKGISGKAEGKINYKNTYNTFPFPSFSKKQESELIDRMTGVLKARGTVTGKLLSDIYCSGKIPDHLEMAHEDLDEVVLDIFGLPSNASNDEILDKLFSEYMKLIEN